MTPVRLAISRCEIEALDPRDFTSSKMTSGYLVKILYEANRLGLAGRKITQIMTIQENFATGQCYLDFVCEP